MVRKIYPVRNRARTSAPKGPSGRAVSNGIYLDYAASTPVAPEVFAAMRPYFSEKYGNPGSLHSFGQEAQAAIAKSREIIAKSIGANFREIIFTGSATEANNLALRGVIKKFLSVSRAERANFNQISSETNRNLPFGRNSIEINRPRIIISSIEHESVLETAKDLASEGIEVLHLPVDRRGCVTPGELKKILNERTVLVSVMYANNEIGTIQPITKISEIIRNFREELGIRNHELRKGNSKFKIHNSLFPLLHTDAVQAFQYLDCDVNKLGVDLMTLSAHKIYGPKGIGALYIRNSKFKILNSKQIPISKSKIQNVSGLGFKISDLQQLVLPIVVGGGQEFGLRSGTENVPNIVGFAKAVELVNHSRELEKVRIEKLKNYFWKELKKIYPPAEINGIMNYESGIMEKLHRNKTLIHNSQFIIPNILNIYFPDHLAQDLLIKLDMAGVAVSSGAACSARSLKPSHVLQALGLPKDRILRSLRFSFGRLTTKQELDEVLRRIKLILTT